MLTIEDIKGMIEDYPYEEIDSIIHETIGEILSGELSPTEGLVAAIDDVLSRISWRPSREKKHITAEIAEVNSILSVEGLDAVDEKAAIDALNKIAHASRADEDESGISDLQDLLSHMESYQIDRLLTREEKKAEIREHIEERIGRNISWIADYVDWERLIDDELSGATCWEINGEEYYEG